MKIGYRTSPIEIEDSVIWVSGSMALEKTASYPLPTFGMLIPLSIPCRRIGRATEFTNCRSFASLDKLTIVPGVEADAVAEALRGVALKPVLDRGSAGGGPTTASSPG
jgi:hypothetical protein